jgi:hypothetical protein
MARALRLILCPYCGHTQPQTDRCVECGGLFEPLSRKATQITMGPWFIRDKRVPFRPGCSFEIIARMVKAGKIKTNTVMRGPTTHQFWSVARNVPGVAHLLGYCHKCGSHVKKEHVACPTCDTVFPVVDERDRMGLVYATKDQAGRAQRELNREVAEANATSPALTDGDDEQASDTKQREREAFLPGPELLNEVLGGPAPGRATSEPVLRPPAIPPAEPVKPTPVRRTPPPAPKSASPLPALAVEEHGALDFTSFNAADAIAEPDEAPAGSALTPQSTRFNATAIALISVNVIVLLLVAIVAMQMTSAPQPADTVADDVSQPVRPDPTAIQTPISTGTQPAPQSPGRDTSPRESTNAPAPSTPAAVDRDASPARTATRSAADAAIVRAQKLEDDGQFQEALAELKAVADVTPLSERPRQLDIAIRRVEGKIKREESNTIFGGLDD